MITAKVDQRALDRYLKVLDKNRGKPLLYRAEKLTNKAARLAVPPVRAAVPASGRAPRPAGPILIIRKRRRTMKQSVGTKLLKKRGNEPIRPTWIGVKHFAYIFLSGGTRMHHLQTRHLERGQRGRWTTPGSSNFGTSNWRSGFAHFPDGEVRSLAGIDVRGITPHDYVGEGWGTVESNVYAVIERDVWATK